MRKYINKIITIFFVITVFSITFFGGVKSVKASYAVLADIKSPKDKATYIVNEKINVVAYSDIFEYYDSSMSQHFNLMYFKVTHNGDKVLYEGMPYFYGGQLVNTSFTPNKSGIYLIEVERFNPSRYASSDLPYEKFRAQESVKINVLSTRDNKLDNPMKVNGKSKSISYKKIKNKRKKLRVSKVLSVKNAKGKLTYKKINGNKKILINKNTGQVVVKKKLKKGTYNVKVRVTANGNKNYKATHKNATFKIKIK